jgi:chromosome partitioning protein
MGKKVLIVAIDPQGNATTGLGLDKSELSGSLYNVLIGGEDASTHILKTCQKGLFLLASSIDLAGAEVELAFMQSREKCLKTAINDIKDNFDYILIDCPPSLGLLAINALVAADSIIIPMQCEYFSLEGASQLLNTVKLIKDSFNPNLTLDGVVLSMYSGRSLVSRQIENEIRGHFKSKVFNTTIPRNVRVAESPSYGLPVILHAENGVGAKAFFNLTDEYLKL